MSEIAIAQIPVKVWIENHGGDTDARDVIVEMEDGTIYTAVFVTFAYLKRQMELTFEVCQQLPDTAPVRFAALDTQHIILDNLERDTIEDTIDNLLAMDVFEGVFIRVTQKHDEYTTTTTESGHRATQEVAAVLLSDVLVVED
jgi:hypothetical protein